jgi:hypothetical protein
MWVIALITAVLVIAGVLAFIGWGEPGYGSQAEALWPANHRCAVCGCDTIYEFRGRPMCTTCKTHAVDRKEDL